jgi:hypothetical protein
LSSTGASNGFSPDWRNKIPESPSIAEGSNHAKPRVRPRSSCSTTWPTCESALIERPSRSSSRSESAIVQRRSW